MKNRLVAQILLVKFLAKRQNAKEFEVQHTEIVPFIAFVIY